MASEQYTPLDGLDDIPWAQLRHANGKASDIPRRLRALASNWNMRDQFEGIELALFPPDGGICSASAPTVRYLVELVGTPKVRIRPDIVDLLARLVMRLNDPGQQPDPHAVACRETLLSLHDRVIMLVKDRNANVRREAVTLLWQYAAMSPRAKEIEKALVARDVREKELAIRVKSRLEGAAAGRTAVLRLAEAVDERLRLANLLARRALDRESVSARELVEAALAPTLPRGAYSAWVNDGHHLIEALCPDENVVARMEIIRLLIARGTGGVLSGALGAAGAVMAKSRSATRSLLPLLGQVLFDDDAQIRTRAADLLASVGEAGTPHAGRLASLLADGDPVVEMAAAWALARQGDERAVTTVLRAVKENSDKLAYHHLSGFEPELGDMVKECAPRYPERVVPVLHAVLEKCGPEPTSVQYQLWRALAACGPAGYGAEDALTLMLASKRPEPALMAFEGFGSAAAHLGPWIEALVRVVQDRWLELWAARVHCIVTGDKEILREVLDSLGPPEDWRFAHAFVRSAVLLDPADRAAVLARAERWVRDNPDRWGMFGVPETVVACGDTELAVTVLTRALDAPEYEPVILEALRAVAKVGSPAKVLRSRVLAVLERDERLTEPTGLRSIVLDDRIHAAALDALGALGS
ncbi:HEAT repeat domain-containing protein [Kutzneria sp. 744]|uniref:HEAT repeat domain-containing protein n=1 Tax=Kutzneria sp. (strain 744) TaxID=345341 RepID=UPI0003EEC784|nr:HEAT repeat domain-containing protein [Kutzneria sp. 744]EWM10846.1 LigA protein [Kutzneria sp. 744]